MHRHSRYDTKTWHAPCTWSPDESKVKRCGDRMHDTSRQPGRPETLLPASWLKYFFPVLVGVGEFVVGILLDLRFGIENRSILYSDVFTGIVAGLLAFFLVRYYERLRRSDAERLHVAAEVNHHVRNALTTVL